MNTWTHIKLAAYIGLITGMIFGTIDIIARIIHFSFEWFELYQTLLFSSITFVIAFIILSILIELFRKLIKFNITKNMMCTFYIACAISFCLLFYSEILIIKFLLFPYTDFTDIKIRSTMVSVTSLIGLVSFIIFVILLIKGKNLIYKKISFEKRRKIKNIFNNYIFIVAIFIISSFFLDLYLLNYTPTNSETGLERKPNIILISIDAVRADHLSLYDYNINTSPNIEELGKKSIVFENAISSASWTLPSHSSLFTGKYVSNHNTNLRHQYLDKKEITLAEILKEEGYNTAAFISAAYLKSRYGMLQGFTIYKDRLDFFDYRLSFDKFSLRYLFFAFFPKFNEVVLNADSEKSSEEINKEVFKWLDKNYDKEPFLMFIHYNDANNPYNLGSEFREEFTNETRKYAFTAEDANYISKLYDNEIYYLDYNFGKLLDKLEQLKIKNNSIIIITADHGEEFYDHKQFMHVKTLYEELIHVPLLIYYPKKFEPKRIEKRVNTMNIFSTILDIVEIDEPKGIDAISLVSLIKENKFERNYTISEILGRIDTHSETEQIAISDGEWKLIEINPPDKNEKTPPSLFNLKNDPKEKINLYDIEIEKKGLLQEQILNLTKNWENKQNILFSTSP